MEYFDLAVSGGFYSIFWGNYTSWEHLFLNLRHLSVGGGGGGGGIFLFGFGGLRGQRMFILWF